VEAGVAEVLEARRFLWWLREIWGWWSWRLKNLLLFQVKNL